MSDAPLLFPPPTRTTVGASGLVVRGDRLLMVRQVRATGTRWEVPGGGQEAAEALEETVVREVAEETGLVVVTGPLICTYASFRVHRQTAVIGAFYRADAEDDAAVPVPVHDDEIEQAAFVDPTTLAPDEVGPLSGSVLSRWWPRRDEPAPPFHVELWRDASGYVLR